MAKVTKVHFNIVENDQRSERVKLVSRNENPKASIRGPQDTKISQRQRNMEFWVQEMMHLEIDTPEEIRAQVQEWEEKQIRNGAVLVLKERKKKRMARMKVRILNRIKKLKSVFRPKAIMYRRQTENTKILQNDSPSDRP